MAIKTTSKKEESPWTILHKSGDTTTSVMLMGAYCAVLCFQSAKGNSMIQLSGSFRIIDSKLVKE